MRVQLYLFCLVNAYHILLLGINIEMNGEHSLIPGCAFCFTKLFAGTFYETKGICAGCAAYGDEVCLRSCLLQSKSGENTLVNLPP